MEEQLVRVCGGDTGDSRGLDGAEAITDVGA